MQHNPKEFLWVQKYRPKKIDDVILPSDIKQTFKDFIDQDNLPNMLLSGSAGAGKTTIALALLEEIGADSIIINGSLNGNIDTLRTTIQNFASTVSFAGGRKYVIIDEADYLTSATQPALRNFMEEFSSNCGFILTCNFANRIIDPIQSRCTRIDFNIKKSDRPKLAKQFFKRVQEILKNEGVEFDSKTVASLIQKHFPDYRKTLNELQKYSVSGKIDAGILASNSNHDLDSLIKFMKEKNYAEVRKWVAQNLDSEPTEFFRKLYDHIHAKMKPYHIPMAVIIIAKYQYYMTRSVDFEINTVACLVELMSECEFQ